jgi:hypothetical protein
MVIRTCEARPTIEIEIVTPVVIPGAALSLLPDARSG